MSMEKVGNILDLKGAVTLITGAGQGLGRQIALHLASYNAGGVVVNDYYLDRAERVAEEVQALGVKAIPVQADVGSFDDVAQMVDRGRSEFGSIDVLVNNAGNNGPSTGEQQPLLKPFWETTPEDWDPWLRVNLYGVLNCTRHVLPGMVAGSGGSIVSIISEAGRYGDVGLEAYAAGKAGTAGVMRSVARGAARHGVRANCVAVAATRTPATEEAFADTEMLKKLMRSYPLRRPADPKEVANTVLFLASDAASYVTGQVYAVNGGLLFTL